MRKLAIASIAYTCAVAFSHFILPQNLLQPIGLGCGLLFLISILLLRGDWRLRVCIITAAAALGFFWYGLYWEKTVGLCSDLPDEPVEISALVTEYPMDYDGTTALYVRLEGENIPNLPARIYDPFGALAEAEPGDRIEASVRLRSSAVRYDEKSDLYTSKGVYLTGYAGEGARLLKKSGDTALSISREIGYKLCRALSAAFPADTAPLMQALCIGDKTAFYRDLHLMNAFRTAGLMHTVAISGLHMALFVGFLRCIFQKRHWSVPLILTVLILYAMVCGGTPSVTRAAFMQSCALLAPLVRRENDPPTTLSAILLVLLLINPMAVASVSLQLSFAATAGLLLFSGRIYGALDSFCRDHGLQNHRSTRAVTRFVCAGISTTVGALILTVPLMAGHFGMISMYSVISNLLCLWAVPVLLVGGLLTAAMYGLLPGVSCFMGSVLSVFARFVITVADRIAGWPVAAIYTTNMLVVVWLVLTYLVFTIWLLAGRRDRIHPLIPVAASALMLAAALSTGAAIHAGGGVMVLDVGQGQCICLQSSGVTAVIDCGATGTLENAGDTAADFLYGAGCRRVDYLVLTHLDQDHVNGVPELLSRMPVSTLLLPADAEDTDDKLSGILKAAEKAGTEVRMISEQTTLEADAMRLFIMPPTEHADSDNARGLAVLGSVGDFDVLVTGDISALQEWDLVRRYDIGPAELLIAGHHGSKYASSHALLACIQPEIAVISVGYNHYGHPTEEAIGRIESAGAVLYRTDLDGTITINLGKEA